MPTGSEKNGARTYINDDDDDEAIVEYCRVFAKEIKPFTIVIFIIIIVIIIIIIIIIIVIIIFIIIIIIIIINFLYIENM